jgi:putative membrane protein
MPYNHMMNWYPYMGFGTVIIWLVIVIVIAYLIYRLIKSEKILVPREPPIKSAEDILAERYAKGELTREQYLQMKEDLRENQG